MNIPRRIFSQSIWNEPRVKDPAHPPDAVITAETQKYEALKTHKKGLMQQLFPSPDAPNT
jgi:type I restriction enzyme S subunit